MVQIWRSCAHNYIYSFCTNGIITELESTLVSTVIVPPTPQHTKRREKLFTSLGDQLLGVFRELPDPDVVLAHTTKGVGNLRELLVDAHLASVWDVRRSLVQVPFLLERANAREDVHAFVQSHIARWNIPELARSIMDAVAFGFLPLELVWVERDGAFVIEQLVPVPPEWFSFDLAAQAFVLKTAGGATKALPPLRFFFVQHHPSILNPYGEKLFSRVFWAVTLKRNGIKWWAEFVERFGAPLLLGKYPRTASEQESSAMLQALMDLVSSSVATAPEDTNLEIIDASAKVGSAAVHQGFSEFLNAEISKGILGQTMTTEVGNTGALATARVHDNVRHDIARSDRSLVASALQAIIDNLVGVNFGDTEAPQFVWNLPEDLQLDRIERDSRLFQMAGRTASMEYLKRYGLFDADVGEAFGAPARAFQDARTGVAMALQDERNEPLDAAFTASDYFNTKRTKQIQDTVDTLVDSTQEQLRGDFSLDSTRAIDVGGFVKELENARWAHMQSPPIEERDG